jgi:hypothetical protein
MTRLRYEGTRNQQEFKITNYFNLKTKQNKTNSYTDIKLHCIDTILFHPRVNTPENISYI